MKVSVPPLEPFKVYLDTSDFTNLSDPGRQDLKPIVEKLREWVTRGAITCHFSGAHLSEMAVLQPGMVEVATRRGNLLGELCARNAMVAHDLLFVSEVGFAAGALADAPTAYSPSGDWFPIDAKELVLDSKPDLMFEMDQRLKEDGLGRADRRRRLKQLFKGGVPRPELQASLTEMARSASLTLPMGEEQARVYARFVVGDATRAEAQAAFLECIRAPAWLLEWIANNPDKSDQFSEWVRGPGTRFFAKLLASQREVKAIIEGGDQAKDAAKKAFALSAWKKHQAETLAGIASRVIKENFAHIPRSLQPHEIDTGCPGLSCAVRSLHTAMRASFGERGRAPLASDFPDGLHAMYAPYVDVFRADSFMAPYVADAVSRHSTVVVQKLGGLIPAIEGLLSKR